MDKILISKIVISHVFPPFDSRSSHYVSLWEEVFSRPGASCDIVILRFGLYAKLASQRFLGACSAGLKNAESQEAGGDFIHGHSAPREQLS